MTNIFILTTVPLILFLYYSIWITGKYWFKSGELIHLILCFIIIGSSYYLTIELFRSFSKISA